MSAHAEASREIEWPNASDGRRVLAIDPHTHSVFSDGLVWPTVRAWEAAKDGLDAWMVTEHIEYQPHANDIPHPDRNRSFNLASRVSKGDTAPLVIAGAEITRRFPPGHVNAIFLTDANALKLDDPREAMLEAQRQGGYTFWNHSWWLRDFADGISKLDEYQSKLIEDGLLEGIEVANGGGVSDAAFQIALDHDLGIVGVSDIHGLIDYDYDIEHGQQRTVTLVLAGERSVSAIKEAFERHQTAALFQHSIYGREEIVRLIVEGALSAERVISKNGQRGTAKIRNGASSPLILRNMGKMESISTRNLMTVPAHGEIEFSVVGVHDPNEIELIFDVLNAYIAPSKNLRIELK